MSTTTDPDTRAAFISGLRELADFLAANPDVPVPSYGTSIQLCPLKGDDDANLLAVREFSAAIGVPAPDGFTKDGRADAGRTFGPIRYHAYASTRAHTDLYNAAQRVAQEYEDSITAGSAEIARAA